MVLGSHCEWYDELAKNPEGFLEDCGEAQHNIAGIRQSAMMHGCRNHLPSGKLAVAAALRRVESVAGFSSLVMLIPVPVYYDSTGLRWIADASTTPRASSRRQEKLCRKATITVQRTVRRCCERRG